MIRAMEAGAQDTKDCPFCGEKIKAAAIKCRHCQSHLHEGPPPGRAGRPSPAGDAVETVIPLKNLPALLAYYAAIFALIPGVGLLLAPLAFVLGLVGRSKVKRDPRIKGTAHAWVGIVLGGLIAAAYLALIVSIALNG